jgi:predicted DNA-binding transcriptional regulator AlpA
MENLNQYVDTTAAANVLGLSRSSLEKFRFYKDPEGPPYVVFGRSAVRYHVATLLEWAQNRTVNVGGVA